MYSDSKEWYSDAYVSPDFLRYERFWRYLSRGKQNPARKPGLFEKIGKGCHGTGMWRGGAGSSRRGRPTSPSADSFPFGADTSPHQTAEIGRGNGPLVDKNHAAVAAAFFRPDLEQRRNGPAIIGDERQLPDGSCEQDRTIVLPQKASVFPITQAVNCERSIATQASGHIGRDVFIQQELEHFSGGMICGEGIRRLGAACASG